MMPSGSLLPPGLEVGVFLKFLLLTCSLQVVYKKQCLALLVTTNVTPGLYVPLVAFV